MKLETLLNEAVTLKEGLELIKANDKTAYIWIPIKNKRGSYFELGGRNEKRLEYKVYIPKHENDGCIVSSNGYTVSDYSITSGGQFDRGSFYHFITNFHLIDFVKFLNNTDFKTYQPTISEEYVEVIVVEVKRKIIL